ncbi:alpha/beta hydrolase [Salinimicrobium xinjiangense]|uniref:alpha/beta hydrolase n=1 Tax=Salinimicrobium xinjiangense TaxID=438596 RepID=UPI0004143217|nr:alpha/beta hydrolase-fold protein [Salinimicrobium xinjiangense]
MGLKNVIFISCFFALTSVFSQSSASSNIYVFTIEAPQLDTVKTIRIYLPEAYKDSEEGYPVIYMHDAQNLFDTTTAFAGERGVDEFLDNQEGQQVIVIGIDHGNEKRIAELTPFAHEKYGGGEAKAYIEFITETLKPHVDSTFRTRPDAPNTSIMGSSLGGLVSFYAAVKHPEIFGKAGVFSPSFWYSDEIFAFAEASEVSPSSKFYFLGGTSEGKAMIPDIVRMKDMMIGKGIPKENLRVNIVEGGEHNESFWSSEFPEAFKWLIQPVSPAK